jgi:hypothetical protein
MRLLGLAQDFWYFDAIGIEMGIGKREVSFHSPGLGYVGDG